MIKFKPIPKELDYLTHGGAVRDALAKAVDHYLEALPILATLNVYRADQLVLASCRGYNPESSSLEEGYFIRYGSDLKPMTQEDILDFLKKNHYPLADNYICLPEVDPK